MVYITIYFDVQYYFLILICLMLNKLECLYVFRSFFCLCLDNNTNENKSTNVERDEVDQSKSWWKKKRKNFDKYF